MLSNKIKYFFNLIGFMFVFSYAILAIYTFFTALTTPGYAIIVSVDIMGEYWIEAPIVIFSIPFVIYVFIDSRKKLEDLKKNAFKNVLEDKI